MRKVRIGIELEVPDWATHVAVDSDGTPVAMSESCDDEHCECRTDEHSKSWFAAMTRGVCVSNWKDTLTDVRKDTVLPEMHNGLTLDEALRLYRETPEELDVPGRQGGVCTWVQPAGGILSPEEITSEWRADRIRRRTHDA